MHQVAILFALNGDAEDSLKAFVANEVLTKTGHMPNANDLKDAMDEHIRHATEEELRDAYDPKGVYPHIENSHETADIKVLIYSMPG